MSETVYIRVDERYPDYWIEDAQPRGRHYAVTVDRQTADRWRRVISEFDAVQDEIDKAVENAPYVLLPLSGAPSDA